MAVNYMDSILLQIPTLEVNSLLKICDHFSITISEEKKTDSSAGNSSCSIHDIHH